jgi:Flp pilus assembly protein TadG
MAELERDDKAGMTRSALASHGGKPAHRRGGRLFARWCGDRGGATPFILVLLPALAGLGGLAYDGGMLFAAKREAYNVASAAARAGANDIDVPSLYASNPILSHTAPGTAGAFATAQGMNVRGVRLINEREIEITVSRSVSMTIWGVVGVPDQTIEATARAEMAETP